MSTADPTLTSPIVVTGKLHRVRQGHAKRFAETPPAMPEQVRRPARVAVMLALAHNIQQALDTAFCSSLARFEGWYNEVRPHSSMPVEATRTTKLPCTSPSAGSATAGVFASCSPSRISCENRGDDCSNTKGESVTWLQTTSRRDT